MLTDDTLTPLQDHTCPFEDRYRYVNPLSTHCSQLDLYFDSDPLLLLNPEYWVLGGILTDCGETKTYCDVEYVDGGMVMIHDDIWVYFLGEV